MLSGGNHNGSQIANNTDNNIINDFQPSRLFLRSGEVFSGFSPVTQIQKAFGEVVFTTGMCGYPESLTDPSYSGQILVFTYPLIGNYGVPENIVWESAKIHVRGVAMSTLVENYSSHTAKRSLFEWLQAENIPLLTGVDTRAITTCIRESGVVDGVISLYTDPPKEFENFSTINFVNQVSEKKPKLHGVGKKTIIVIDCGIKANILRELLKFPVAIKQVPWDYDFTNEDFDGVFISNGPGDPRHCEKTVNILKKVLTMNKPVFGICLGTQLLAMAAGARTYKLSYGHRSQNQPCQELESGRCYLTSQNHNYAVDESTLPEDWQVYFRNLNDQSIEGIKHKTLPLFAVQFHPEAAPGPLDTTWLFKKFYDSINVF